MALLPTPTRPDTRWWAGALRACESVTEPPPWARRAGAALDLAGDAGRSYAGCVDSGADWQDQMACIFAPLLDGARAELAAGPAVAAPAVEAVVAGLGRRLAHLAGRVLVSRLGQARAAGSLRGDSPQARFTDFVVANCQPGALTALLAEYPVLARVLAQTTEQLVRARQELIDRLTTDREDIVATLLDGVDPGQVISIDAVGDTHDDGRSVASLTFADGRKVVYKPRPVDAHVHFNAVLAWIGHRTGLQLSEVPLVSRPGYGWSGFVAPQPCTTTGQVRDFYRRQGVLLAVLHALDATDMHCENVVAVADQPLIVDVETLFHPRLTWGSALGDDPAAVTLNASVQRTALLPMILMGEAGIHDVSGLGGDAGAPISVAAPTWVDEGLDTMHLGRIATTSTAAHNRPQLAGRIIDPGAHEPSLLAGFRLAYDALGAGAEELLGPGGPIAHFADDLVRFVVRPTRAYAALLHESTHPTLARDAAARDDLFAVLASSSAHPVHAVLAPAEIDAMWRGDVPLVSCRPGSRDVWTCDGARIPQLLDVTPLALVGEKLRGFGERDRERQEWIIRASLATREIPSHASATSVDIAPAPAATDGILRAVTRIADAMVAQSITDGRRANWLGLELVDDRYWALQPMAGSLSTGYLGTALFLAEVARLTGAQRYLDLAAEAIVPLPGLTRLLEETPDLAETVGLGYHGLGGILAGLHRLVELGLGSTSAPALDTTIRVIRAQSERVGPRTVAAHSYVDGTAGLLAALKRVSVSRSDVSDLVATQAALVREIVQEQLLDHDDGSRSSDATPGERADVGFARGLSGLLWATGAGEAGANAALEVVERLPGGRQRFLETPGEGWCAGRAGLALVTTTSEAMKNRYVDWAARRPVLRDLSLCHGELGALESLIRIADHDSGARAVLGGRTAMVLAVLEQLGPVDGTPRRITSPGLLTGQAGVGLGLLRLGFTADVPSPLVFDAPPVTPTQGDAP